MTDTIQTFKDEGEICFHLELPKLAGIGKNFRLCNEPVKVVRIDNDDEDELDINELEAELDEHRELLKHCETGHPFRNILISDIQQLEAKLLSLGSDIKPMDLSTKVQDFAKTKILVCLEDQDGLNDTHKAFCSTIVRHENNLFQSIYSTLIELHKQYLSLEAYSSSISKDLTDKEVIDSYFQLERMTIYQQNHKIGFLLFNSLMDNYDDHGTYVVVDGKNVLAYGKWDDVERLAS